MGVEIAAITGLVSLGFQALSMIAGEVAAGKEKREAIEDYSAAISDVMARSAETISEASRRISVTSEEAKRRTQLTAIEATRKIGETKAERNRRIGALKEEGVLSLKEQGAQAAFEGRMATTQAEMIASSEEARLGTSGVRAKGSPLLAAQQNVDLAFAAADRTIERGRAGMAVGGVRLKTGLTGISEQSARTVRDIEAQAGLTIRDISATQNIAIGDIRAQESLLTAEYTRQWQEMRRRARQLAGTNNTYDWWNW